MSIDSSARQLHHTELAVTMLDAWGIARTVGTNHLGYLRITYVPRIVTDDHTNKVSHVVSIYLDSQSSPKTCWMHQNTLSYLSYLSFRLVEKQCQTIVVGDHVHIFISTTRFCSRHTLSFITEIHSWYPLNPSGNQTWLAEKIPNSMEVYSSSKPPIETGAKMGHTAILGHWWFHFA